MDVGRENYAQSDHIVCKCELGLDLQPNLLFLTTRLDIASQEDVYVDNSIHSYSCLLFLKFLEILKMSIQSTEFRYSFSSLLVPCVHCVNHPRPPFSSCP